MKMCDEHFDQLHQAVIDRGVGEWVITDSEEAAKKLVALVSSGGEYSKDNYDPLMAAHNMIVGNAVDMVGLPIMTKDENGNPRCPICFLNSKRNEDGSCPCGKPDCGGREPGSIPPFEEWIDHAADGAKQFMVDREWVSA